MCLDLFKELEPRLDTNEAGASRGVVVAPWGMLIQPRVVDVGKLGLPSLRGLVHPSYFSGRLAPTDPMKKTQGELTHLRSVG